MRYLINLELRKFASQKHHWFLILIFCFLLGSDISAKIRTQLSITDYLNTEVFAAVTNLKMNSNDLRTQLTESPENMKLTEILQWIEEDLNYHYKMQYAVMSENWESYLENKIASDQLRLAHFDETRTYQVWYETRRDLENRIAINQILFDEKIIPMDTVSSMTGYNALVLFFGGTFIYVILGLCIYFSSSSLPSEFENGTYKLLLTQPISKMKILLSKLMASLLINYSWIFIIMGIILVSINKTCGMGDSRYPIKLFVGGVSTYTSMQTYIVMASLFLLLLVTLVTVLSFCLAVWIKNSTLTLVISISIIMLLAFLPIQYILSGVAHLNPFSYLMLNESLSGNLAYNIGNQNVDVNYGLFALVGSIIVITIISLIGFKHQVQKN